MTNNLFMQRCFELALKGLGNVAPNPLVGAVIILNDKIIGEGYHQQFGGAHAEVNAIQNAIENGFVDRLQEAVLYVNLEPCSHFGKTPPCCDLIIRHGFKEVVVCNVDPNPIVAGSGIRKINEAGIKIETGILANEGKELNKRFFTFHQKKRPYIILKFAQSKDGFIAPSEITPESRKISNDLSNKLVHQWRSEESAIMIGTKTAMIDNPSLTVRHYHGKNPIRLVIDKDCKIPKTNLIFNEDANTIIFNSFKNYKNNTIEFVKIDFDKNAISEIIQWCFQKQILSVLVEGGANLHRQFVDLNLWDEVRTITSEKEILNGTRAVSFNGILQNEFQLEKDTIKIFTSNI